MASAAQTAAPARHGTFVSGGTTTITPIFSQLLSFKLPTGFVTSDARYNDRAYIREAVPNGETVDNWTQMITVMAGKGLADLQQATPEAMAEMAGAAYARACPNSLAIKDLGPTQVDGNDAFLAFFGCGTIAGVGTAAHSESMLVLTIKGHHDNYTLEWAERGPASSKQPQFDRTKWMLRLNRLAPIKLCAIRPGEAAPYPSCIDRKVSEHFR